jgi:hypothetical protein
MKTSLHTSIRFTGLTLAAALLVAVVAGPAFARTGATPNSAIDAASANWAAKAVLLNAYGQPRVVPSPLSSAVRESGASWAAKAKLLNAYGQPKVVPSPSSGAIDAASANWAAKAKLLNAYGQPFVRSVPNTTGGGLDWGDFGMGAAAMLGLLMLGSGVIAGAYYSRKSGAGRRAAL